MKKAVNKGAMTTHLMLKNFFEKIELGNYTSSAATAGKPTALDKIELEKQQGRITYFHSGIYTSHESGSIPSDEEAFQHAVTDLCDHINPHEHVYEIAGGFCEASYYLQNSKNCNVLTAVSSIPQFKHCIESGIKCRLADIESTLPPGIFDTVVMLESLELIRDKHRFLKNLRPFSRKLVIRVNTSEKHEAGQEQIGIRQLISSIDLQRILHDCGYKIIHYQDRKTQSLPSLAYWQRQFKKEQIDAHPIYKSWRDFIMYAQNQKHAWAAQHRLIDIVAV